ncbi:hypothetical protein B0H12DRAFT_1079442 [Mycena haematopus]|nr:hypothetical protein B0H12DRAFT_1079442 [Mycena haematopus]
MSPLLTVLSGIKTLSGAKAVRTLFLEDPEVSAEGRDTFAVTSIHQSFEFDRKPPTYIRVTSEEEAKAAVDKAKKNLEVKEAAVEKFKNMGRTQKGNNKVNRDRAHKEMENAQLAYIEALDIQTRVMDRAMDWKPAPDKTIPADPNHMIVEEQAIIPSLVLTTGPCMQCKVIT